MIPTLALLSTFVLRWSAIHVNAGPDCTSTAVAFSVPITYSVRRINQSATYLAHRAYLGGVTFDPDSMRVYWPTVRQQAEPVEVAATTDTFATVTDTTGAFYVVAVKPSGAESPCRGSMVVRP